MMAENQKSVFLRFNMDDKVDKELYQKLVNGSGSATSLASYVKRVLGEHFDLDIRIADNQEFHRQVLEAIHEEMQSQGMKLVGALLAGIGTMSVQVPQNKNVAGEVGAELPQACEELPDGLCSILEFIG